MSVAPPPEEPKQPKIVVDDDGDEYEDMDAYVEEDILEDDSAVQPSQVPLYPSTMHSLAKVTPLL